MSEDGGAEDSPPTPGREVSPASPSIFSPVGDARYHGYSVTADGDDHDLRINGVSPVPHELPESPVVNDDSWQYYDNDEAEPPRLRLESDLNAPLLNQHPEQIKLNGLNYLNVLTYFLNVFVSYGIGVWGLDGILPTRVDVFLESETLITPARWAYFLWAPILVFEAIFAIAQLTPHYRARPIIQQGTGFYFFYTCLIQTAWTLFFSFRLFTLSFVAVVCALLSMAFLLANQHFSRVRGRKSLLEYWLFRFPFYLHCGWLILCSVVQFSILFRHLTSNVGVQLASDGKQKNQFSDPKVSECGCQTRLTHKSTF
jgi:hypothetical protein